MVCYNIKYCTTDVLSHGDALIYIAKRLFIAVVNFESSCKTTLRTVCGAACMYAAAAAMLSNKNGCGFNKVGVV